ncbi:MULTISPECIES: acyl-CoA dehydrogenase family protein [Gordonia]|nr:MULTISPECIES: acyl-CoA dehydrogenase family protein [Gordonia]KJR04519.1 acyl-CoA dehydrogenase [Gordonia sihwensis]KXT57348.1 acyl-CoA dehydrogenase [Gordonia sp. QH-12]MBY4569468.1 acyl-CoA dehydrogenase [Gordonia sihwensis]WFN93983.1 acyl-CoA dehydrogenase family protein [Gordonia sihwensis]GAC61104.1 putative acyl-CoA dehydrogenase [Gordonia sihwensis NBRC 108236]
MFEWSEEDVMVRDAVRGFIDKEVRPNLEGLESGSLPPYDILRKMLATFGMDSMNAESLEKELAAEEAGEPRSSGGGSNSLANSMFLILNMEMAGVSLGLIASMGVSLGLTVSTIRSRGTLAQKRRWLPELVTMEKVGAWAITEPDSGSDALGGMKTTVRRDGDDYILNGNKTFITNGPYADTMVVFAKLDEGDGTPMRDRKVLTFVLDKGMEGLTQGKPFKKMGMMSSPTGELFFDNVRVGRDRLLGETEETGSDKRGGDSAKAGFTAERIGIAALSLGIINECQRLSIDYAKTRTLWGQEIGKFQLIQLKLAEMEIARLNVQNMLFVAMEAAKAGKPPTLAQASAMKLYSSRAATEVAMEAVQLFGGNGYMAEYRVEQLARDAKSLMIYAGSNEIQVTHVAKGLLAQ